MQPFLPPAAPGYARSLPPPLAHGISLSDSIRCVEEHGLLPEVERDCYVPADAIWLQQKAAATWKIHAEKLKNLQAAQPSPREEEVAQAHATLEQAAEAKAQQTIDLGWKFSRWAETHRQDEQSGRLAAAAMAIVIANAPYAQASKLPEASRDMEKEKAIRARYLDIIDEAREYFTQRYVFGVEPFSQLESAAAFMATGKFSLAAQQIKKGVDSQESILQAAFAQDDVQWNQLKTRLSALQFECEQYSCVPPPQRAVPALPATPSRVEKILQAR